MKKAKQTPIDLMPHPLEVIIFEAFEDDDIHTEITLLPYIGLNDEFSPMGGVANYRAVVKDALLYMVKQGRLKTREGLYSLKG